MGRPAGVTASSVVAVIGSAFVLIVGAFMAFGVMMAPEKPESHGAVVGIAIVAGVVFVGFAATGAWTGIGLWRMRPWARISTLIFAGFMTAGCALLVVLMLFMPLPDQTGALAGMRPFLASIYAIPLAVGVWWLIYFNRSGIKQAFAEPYVPGAPPLRPLSVSIIGWFSVIGGAIVLPFALLHLPAYFMGFVITGWAGSVVYVGFGALSLYLGWSVLKLKELGRRLLIGWYGFTMLQTMYISLVPGARAKMFELQRSMPFGQPATPVPDTGPIVIVSMLFGVGMGAVAIWFLVKERSRFT